MPNTMDTNPLQMALVGYEAERQKIQEKIDEITDQLKGQSLRTATPATTGRSSAATRKRIAVAQT